MASRTRMLAVVAMTAIGQVGDNAVADGNATWLLLEHDSAGNTTSRQTANGTYTHVHDGFDRQREVTAPDGRREVYWYGGDGSRAVVATLSPSGEVERVRWSFGGTEIWYGPNHAVTKSIAHVEKTARIEDRTKLEHVFTDQYGHTLADLGDNGTMLAGFVYGPFGETLREVGNEAAEVTRRFNGKEHDELSGLSYYGARYYDPLSLAWTQADPLYRVVPDTANAEPRRMSAYAFSLNNPLRYVDPDGLDDTSVYGDYTVHVRRYAKPAEFGGGFEGDGRGPSTSSNATFRTGMHLTFNAANQTLVRARGSASRSRAIDAPATWMAFVSHVTLTGIAKVAVDASATKDGDLLYVLGSSSGSNPLAPPGTPAIDTNIAFGAELLTRGGVTYLAIAGGVFGNSFPSTEVFIRDGAGNTVMLGTADTDGGPFVDLWGAAEDHALADFKVLIPLDEDGNFTGTPTIETYDNNVGTGPWKLWLRTHANTEAQ